MRSTCRSTVAGWRRLPGQPPADGRWSASTRRRPGWRRRPGTVAFLIGLGWWTGEHVPPGPAAAARPGRGRRRCSTRSRAHIPPDAWLVTYNGRGFDWPLLVTRFRMARRAAPDHAGHLDLLPLVRRLFRHRMDDARLGTVERTLLGVVRHDDVDGWEIPGRYLGFLRGGPAQPLAAVVRHNDEDVRSLARLLAHIERGLGDPIARTSAPRGDLAGLARAFRRERRFEEAVDCLDAALAADPAPPPPRSAGRAGASRGHRGAVVVTAQTGGLRWPPGATLDQRRLGSPPGVRPAMGRGAHRGRSSAPAAAPGPHRRRTQRLGFAGRWPRPGRGPRRDRGGQAPRAPPARSRRRDGDRGARPRFGGPAASAWAAGTRTRGGPAAPVAPPAAVDSPAAVRPRRARPGPGRRAPRAWGDRTARASRTSRRSSPRPGSGAARPTTAGTGPANGEPSAIRRASSWGIACCSRIAVSASTASSRVDRMHGAASPAVRSIDAGSRPTARQCSSRMPFRRAERLGVVLVRVPDVGVLRDDAQRPLLAAAADREREPRLDAAADRCARRRPRTTRRRG